MPKEKQDAGVNVTEILNIQILQDTIKNLEESKLKLLLTIKELKEQLAQQKEDQADIYYYLNKKCDESFEVIASLEEQLLNEQSDREIAERQYETKIDELKTNYLNMESKLTAKIGELETKLEMVNKYGESKDEMERTLHELMNKLEEERQQFRTNIESIENKYLLEREKLRKSYEIKYENMKKELEASIDGKISKKTQRTQIMNVVIRKELDTQSKHADRLLEINDDIVERDKQLKIDLELASSLQQELTRKLHANEKITKKFKDDYDQINEEMKQQRQQCDEQLKQKNEEIENLQKTIQQLSRRQEKRNKNMDDMWDFLSHNYQHLIKYSKLYSDKSTSSLPAQKDQTLNKSASVTSQYSNNPFSPPKSIAKQHEEILKELIKNLAIKYPDEVKQYLNFGKQIAERTAKRNNKSGIPSWDNQAQSSLSSYHSQYEDNNYDDSNDEGGGAVKVRHQMVQTEELLALFPSDSVWNNASSAALPRINQSAYSPRSTRGGGSGESIQITMVHSPIPPTYYGATSPTAGGAPSVSSATVSTGRGSRKGGQLAGSGSHPNTAETNRHSQPQQPPQRSTYTRPFKFIDINKWDSSQSIFSQDSSVSVLSKHPTTTKYQQQSMLMNDLQSLASSMSLSYQGSSVAGVHSLPTYILGTSLQTGGGGGGGGNKGGIYPLSGSLDSMSQVYPHTVTGGPTMTKEKKSAPPSKHRSLRHPSNNSIHGDALTTQSMTSADGRGLGSFYDDATVSLLSHTPDLSVTARTVKRSNNEEDDVSAILQEDYQEHDYDDSMASSSMPTPLKPVNYYELTQQQRQPSLQQIDSESQSDEIIESDREREESVVLDLPSVHAVTNDSHSVDSASIAMSLASTNNNSNHVIPPPNPNKRSLPPSPMIKASVNVIGGSSSSLQSAGSSQTKGQPQSNLVINSRVKYTVDPHYRGSAGGTRGNSSGNLSVSNNSSVVSLGITPNSSTPIVSQLLMSPLTSHLPPPSHPSTAGDNTVNTTGLTLHSTSSTSSHLKDSVDALEMSIAGKKFVLASQK